MINHHTCLPLDEEEDEVSNDMSHAKTNFRRNNNRGLALSDGGDLPVSDDMMTSPTKSTETVSSEQNSIMPSPTKIAIAQERMLWDDYGSDEDFYGDFLWKQAANSNDIWDYFSSENFDWAQRI